jgi:hypothetical protein
MFELQNDLVSVIEDGEELGGRTELGGLCFCDVGHEAPRLRDQLGERIGVAGGRIVEISLHRSDIKLAIVCSP